MGDVGVPSSAELLAFTNAVELGGDIEAARTTLAEAIGATGALEAAATIAIFNGLVRVADGTGIRLDDGVFSASVDDRARLGIDRFTGAANSADVRATTPASGGAGPIAVDELFG